MKQEINLEQFAQAFKDYDRDYYSWEGYQALYDYYDEFEDFDLDVIAVCCDVSEYDLDEIRESYGYLVGDFDEWVEENKDIYETLEEREEEYLDEILKLLENMTMRIGLDNGSSLVWEF